MTLVYHSTDTGNGILIARSGAIRSNLEKSMDFFNSLYHERLEIFEKQYPGKTIEQVALEFESGFYSEHEIEARVKSLSVAENIEQTKRYALRFEGDGGGLILGIDLADSYIGSLAQHHSNPKIKFVKGKLDIGTLKEIFLSPAAKRRYEPQIMQEFGMYAPKYFTIE